MSSNVQTLDRDKPQPTETGTARTDPTSKPRFEP